MRVHPGFLLLAATLLLLAGCKGQPKAEAPIDKPAPAAISDPTPPDPPNSVEVSARDLNNMPAFLTMAIGGIANEGEKEGIQVQENLRLFRTDTATSQLVAFYSGELKQRGWTTDSQVAQSSTVGLTMQQYRHGAEDALFVIVSEPEDPRSADEVKAKRHVALLPATVTKSK
jgi:hypothetical protein